jgi:hypothetical protein
MSNTTVARVLGVRISEAVKAASAMTCTVPCISCTCMRLITIGLHTAGNIRLIQATQRSHTHLGTRGCSEQAALHVIQHPLEEGHQGAQALPPLR